MIISASRRTDIPNYYVDWFFNRIKQQYVLTRNPMNIHQVSKISLSPDVVDCIVFWTKNPSQMINRLNELNEYAFYFQFTLNSYGMDVEPNVPSKNDAIIKTFQRLSDFIGADRIIWRYDPIFINQKYSFYYHVQYFERLAKLLNEYTKKCTISFLDYYKNITNKVRELQIQSISSDEKRTIAKSISEIAHSYGLKVDTCAEDIELSEFNISHARCIDDSLIERITGFGLDIEKDKSQRLECGCVASIDIGMYNTCRNECKYCYANFSSKTVEKNFGLHDVNSPLLCGQLTADDIVTERQVRSCKNCQTRF